MAITDVYQRDANQVPITGLGLIASKTITYDAATTGAIGATNLFAITGTVALRIFGVCSVNLTGSGTLEVGIAGMTNLSNSINLYSLYLFFILSNFLLLFGIMVYNLNLLTYLFILIVNSLYTEFKVAFSFLFLYRALITRLNWFPRALS